MAIYEYQCGDCRAKFTLSERISHHASGRKRPPCPRCGGRNTRQLLSTFFAKTASKS